MAFVCIPVWLFGFVFTSKIVVQVLQFLLHFQYAGDYSVTLRKEESRYLSADNKYPILGTTNSITISCEGVVKVGYDISKINVRVADEVIYISLPEPEVNDNYVKWDSVECVEENNILNPINYNQYQDLISDIEERGYNNVVEEGIFEKADENIKVIIMFAFVKKFK